MNTFETLLNEIIFDTLSNDFAGYNKNKEFIMQVLTTVNEMDNNDIINISHLIYILCTACDYYDNSTQMTKLVNTIKEKLLLTTLINYYKNDIAIDMHSNNCRHYNNILKGD